MIIDTSTDMAISLLRRFGDWSNTGVYPSKWGGNFNNENAADEDDDLMMDINTALLKLDYLNRSSLIDKYQYNRQISDHRLEIAINLFKSQYFLDI